MSNSQATDFWAKHRFTRSFVKISKLPEAFQSKLFYSAYRTLTLLYLPVLNHSWRLLSIDILHLKEWIILYTPADLQPIYGSSHKCVYSHLTQCVITHSMARSLAKNRIDPQLLIRPQGRSPGMVRIIITPLGQPEFVVDVRRIDRGRSVARQLPPTTDHCRLNDTAIN